MNPTLNAEQILNLVNDYVHARQVLAATRTPRTRRGAELTADNLLSVITRRLLDLERRATMPAQEPAQPEPSDWQLQRDLEDATFATSVVQRLRDLPEPRPDLDALTACRWLDIPTSLAGLRRAEGILRQTGLQKFRNKTGVRYRLAVAGDQAPGMDG